MNRYHNKVGGRKTRKQHESKELNKSAARLKTLLKLPKAHKWVIYEWFYGNLDQSLFKLNQDSEFQLCLKELFPNLKTKSLRRAEWCLIRKLMGKPRRCSPSFFAEERQSLNAKRDKIRQIQFQQKLDTLSNYHDLPNLIPMPLVIGTRITALQRKPHDGLFNGTIEAVDILNGTYRIAFDRPDIAADTVLDHDIRSIAPTEFMPLQAFLYKSRPPTQHSLPVYTPAKLMEMINEQDTSPFEVTQEQSELLNESMPAHNPVFPIKFLAKVVKAYKILDFKRRRIYELKMMNNEIEKIRSNPDETIPNELQKQYANNVLDLDKLDRCLLDSLKHIRQFSNDLALSQKAIAAADETTSAGTASAATPLVILNNKENCEATKLVSHHAQKKEVNQSSIDLISNLIKILVHLKDFNRKEVNAEEIKSLNESVNEAKDGLSETNVELFENKVEVNVNYIQTEGSCLGNLGVLANSEVYCS